MNYPGNGQTDSIDAYLNASAPPTRSERRALTTAPERRTRFRQPQVSDSLEATLGKADSSRHLVAGVAHHSSQGGTAFQSSDAPERPRPEVQQTVQCPSHPRPLLPPTRVHYSD
ncbi:MAG TPA: hypothetical protein VIX84_15225, partial [Acidimicrobiales bacterium]